MDEKHYQILERIGNGGDGLQEDGRNLRPLKRQKFIQPRKRGGWKITPEGRQALRNYQAKQA